MFLLSYMLYFSKFKCWPHFNWESVSQIGTQCIDDFLGNLYQWNNFKVWFI